ncbi:MAG: hypothetical protein ACRDJI_07590, partial [Actinomycetota bacterium]
MRRLRPFVFVTLAALVFSIDARGVVDHPRTHASIPHHRLGPPLPVDTAAAKEDPCTGAGSGPRAVAHLAGGRAIESEPAAKSAPEPCLYRTGFNAAEPTLGVAKDGTVYYQTLDAEQWPAFPVQVIRSTDEGRTWKDVSPKFGPSNRHAYTEDPYIYVDADTGRVFTVDYLLPCSELSFTDDGGKNWTTVVMGCDVVDHQTIFSGPPVEGGSEPIGYKNIVYY